MRFFLLHFNCSFAKSPLAAVTILTPTHIAAAGALLAAAKVVLPIPYLDQELSQRIKLGHAHCCFIGLSSLLLSLPPWITTLGLEKSFGLVHHVAKIWTIHISVFEKLWARMRPLQSSRSSSSWWATSSSTYRISSSAGSRVFYLCVPFACYNPRTRKLALPLHLCMESLFLDTSIFFFFFFTGPWASTTLLILDHHFPSLRAKQCC